MSIASLWRWATRPPFLAWNAWLFKVGLGVMLVWAGAAKFIDPHAFGIEISNFHFLPQLAPYLATTLPSLEAITGVILIVLPLRNLWLHAAAWFTTALMAAFTVAVAQVWLRGINVDCGCFGAGSGPVTALTVLRDVLLLGASVTLVACLRVIGARR